MRAKLDQLIKSRRGFLRQATKDYATGGNDMLDDVNAVLKEAKAELLHNLELASVLRRGKRGSLPKGRPEYVCCLVCEMVRRTLTLFFQLSQKWV